MRRGYILEWIGAAGALASIWTVAQPLLIKFALLPWLHSPVGVPTWLAGSVFLGMSLLLLVAGRLLVSRGRPQLIPSGAHAVGDYVTQNSILKTASRLDLWHYTVETVVIAWRDMLEKHATPIAIRMLMRRPETDPGKQQLAEGALKTVREICEANPNLDIDLRFYSQDPLLRLQFYSGSGGTICFLGVYRYDAQRAPFFFGAEENCLLVLNTKRQPEADTIRACQTRFERQWKSSSCLRAVIFDMDGVLVNTMSQHLHAWREAFRADNLMVDEARFRRDVYLLEGLAPDATVRELFARHLGTTPTPDVLARIVSKKTDLYLALHRNL